MFAEMSASIGSVALATVLVLASLAVGALGAWLLLRRTGVIHARGNLNILGFQAEGPVSVLLIVLMIAGLYFAQSNFSGQTESKVATLNGELATARSERDGFKGQAETQRQRADSEKIRADSAEAEVARLSPRVSELQNEVEGLRAQAEKLRRQIGSLEADNRNGLSEIESLNSEINRKTNEISDLEQQISVVLDERNSALLLADTLRLSPAEKRRLDDIVESFEKIGNGLTYLSVQRVPFPRFEQDVPVAVFEVYSKDFEEDRYDIRGAGLLSFNSESFDIEGDYAHELLATLSGDLGQAVCDTATRIIAGEVGLSEAIQRIPEIAKYDADSDLIRKIAELQFLTLRVKTLSVETLMLVRAYADGEDGPWKHSLQGGQVQMDVFRNAIPEQRFEDAALIFERNPNRIIVGDVTAAGAVYGNEDLPNLRALTTQEIVEVLVDGCSVSEGATVGDVSSGILDGYVYPAKNEIDRKSRLFVMVRLRDN